MAAFYASGVRLNEEIILFLHVAETRQERKTSLVEKDFSVFAYL